MPKKKNDEMQIAERFERALRRALNTAPETPRAPRKKTKRKRAR